MKKIIFLGIITFIAVFSLHGCAEPAQPADTTDFQYSDESKEYVSEEIGFKFSYPANFDIKVSDEDETILRIQIGDLNEETDTLVPVVLFTIERSDYFARLLENNEEGGFALRNACEEAELVSYVKDCAELKEGITGYLEVTKMAALGFQKTYFVETPNEEWPSAAFAVNLYTPEDAARYEDPETELLQKELSNSQKKRIEMTDEIARSLEFI